MKVTRLKSVRFISCFVLLLAATTHAKAQEKTTEEEPTEEVKANTVVNKFGISLNVGAVVPYADINEKKIQPLIGVGFSYYACSYLHLNADLQKGWLKGGDMSDDNSSNTMGSSNSYFSGSVMVRFLPFGLSKNTGSAMNILSGIYGGAGLGFIANSVSSNETTSLEFGSIGDYSGVAAMVPIEVGINIPVMQMTKNRHLLLNANLRSSLCLSDKIDGYVPTVGANKKNDAFNSFTVGIVYSF